LDESSSSSSSSAGGQRVEDAPPSADDAGASSSFSSSRRRRRQLLRGRSLAVQEGEDAPEGTCVSASDHLCSLHGDRQVRKREERSRWQK
jgi:hypothetical protein